jgi:hypothetical protein
VLCWIPISILVYLLSIWPDHFRVNTTYLAFYVCEFLFIHSCPVSREWKLGLLWRAPCNAIHIMRNSSLLPIITLHNGNWLDPACCHLQSGELQNTKNRVQIRMLKRGNYNSYMPVLVIGMDWLYVGITRPVAGDYHRKGRTSIAINSTNPNFSARFFFSSYMFFSSQPFCPFTFFFFWWQFFFLECFFWPHPWPQFVLGTSYLPL